MDAVLASRVDQYVNQQAHNLTRFIKGKLSRHVKKPVEDAAQTVKSQVSPHQHGTQDRVMEAHEQQPPGSGPYPPCRLSAV